MEVEVGAEDVFGRVAGGVGVAGAVFGEEEGVRDFFERLGAGEVEFMSAQLFAFRGYHRVAQRARRDVADGAQAVVHFAAHRDDAAHLVRRSFEVFYFAREVHEAAAFGVYGHSVRRGASDRFFHGFVRGEARGEYFGKAAAEDEAAALGYAFVVQRAERYDFRARGFERGEALGVVEGECFVARDGDFYTRTRVALLVRLFERRRGARDFEQLAEVYRGLCHAAHVFDVFAVVVLFDG